MTRGVGVGLRRTRRRAGCGSGRARLQSAWEARQRAGFNRARVPGRQRGATAGGTEGDDRGGRVAPLRITLRVRGVRGFGAAVPSVANSAWGGRQSGGGRLCAVRGQVEACGGAAAVPSRASRATHAEEKGGRQAVVGRAAARSSRGRWPRTRKAGGPPSTWNRRRMRGCDATAILSVADGARVGECRAAGGGAARYAARVRRAGVRRRRRRERRTPGRRAGGEQ